MELLLNLAWLLLALPACWLWRKSRNTGMVRKFGSLQCVLALGCLLVMLFPVISASDDLLALRTEMEESPLSKRSIRQAGTEKSSLAKTGLQTAPALPATLHGLEADLECARLLLSPAIVLRSSPWVSRSGRAPPVFHRA